MNIKKLHLPILFILGVFLFLIGNNSIALTDPDETFYSLTAKEMISNNSYLTPLIFDEPQFEKHPLFYWFLMLSFKIFGIIPFAARFVPAFFGLIGILGTYFFLKKIFDEDISFYSSLVMATTIFYVGLSKAVLTDLVFSVFIFFSFLSFYLWYKKEKGSLILFAVFLALAVLTKGPVALVMLLAGVSLFLVLVKDFNKLKSFLINKWWLVFLVISLPWYIYVTLKYGRVFYEEFIINDNWRRIIEAEHRNFDRWWFYPVVIIGGVFPWTFYYITLDVDFKKYKNEFIFLFSWIASVLLIFTVAHSKLLSYIAPLCVPLSIIIGTALLNLDGKPKRTNFIGVLNILLALALFPPLWFVKKLYPDFLQVGIWGVILLSFFLVLSGIMLFKKEFKKAIILNLAGFLAVAIILPVKFPFKVLEPAVSDSDLPAIVAQYNYKGPILSNKLFARGTHFYTGNKVVVLGKSGSPFWSKHPVEVVNINNDSEINNFFDNKDEVLCVIRTKELKRLEELLGNRRKNKIISENFGRAVVLSTKISP